MIKAYHATSKIGFGHILTNGALLPLAMRAAPFAINELCQEEVQDHYSHYLPPRVVAALVEILKERVEAFHKKAPNPPSVRSPQGIHMHCFEFITGGADYVYLSPLQWEETVVEYYSGGKPWGFVFNLVELLQNGAVLMREPFEWVLSRKMAAMARWGLPKTKEEAKQAILDTLRHLDESLLRWPVPEEELTLPNIDRYFVAFPGPLPIKRAVEIWADGTRDREFESRYISA